MRASQLLIPTLKETPADADIPSHRFMLRAGLIRRLAAGIYTWLPLGLRVLRKVEAIVREELNRSGAQEVLMPFVQPAELWQESNRWDQMGPEMLRLKDRHQRDFCLGPTHEEVITDLVRREVQSYKQLPCNLYQINLKFRDEIRPRFGVMRAREFLMKDGYSFHIDDASFDATYAEMYACYGRILARMQLDFRAVLADTGNIGGSTSHEFQVLASTGEDRIAFSDASDYAANVEKAEAVAPAASAIKAAATLEKVATPGQHTIDEVAAFFAVPASQTLKTLIVVGTDGPVALVLRGDHELNEIKAAKFAGIAAPLAFATDQTIRATVACGVGSLGPIGLGLPTYVDRSAYAAVDFICGANTDGYHYRGANWGDVGIAQDRVVDLRNVVDGDPSPDGRGKLSITRGIEVGHIFQLGRKYSESLGAHVLDADGSTKTLIMGCYGMGITRLVGAIIEQCHDDNGIIWPQPVAPFLVHLVALNYTKSPSVRATADRLLGEFEGLNIETLLDDRDERPGVKFADADLIGIPHRVVIGERNLKAGEVEYRTRRSADTLNVTVDTITAYVRAALAG
ncbi:MAG TPA: proline--tRNA ligase [Pseudomonadales bacterium]